MTKLLFSTYCAIALSASLQAQEEIAPLPSKELPQSVSSTAKTDEQQKIKTTTAASAEEVEEVEKPQYNSFQDPKTKVGFRCTNESPLKKQEESYQSMNLANQMAAKNESVYAAQLNQKAVKLMSESKAEMQAYAACRNGLQWLAGGTYGYQAAITGESVSGKIYANKTQNAVTHAQNTKKDMALVGYDTTISTAKYGENTNNRQAAYGTTVVGVFGKVYASWSRYSSDPIIAQNLQGLYSMAAAYGVDVKNFVSQAGAYKTQREQSEIYRNEYLALQNSQPATVDCKLTPTDPTCTTATTTTGTTTAGWNGGGNYTFPDSSADSVVAKTEKANSMKTHIPGTASPYIPKSNGSDFEVSPEAGTATGAAAQNAGAAGKSVGAVSAGALKGWSADDRKKQQAAKSAGGSSEYTADYSKTKKKNSAAVAAAAAKEAKVANPFEKLFGGEGEPQQDENVGIRIIAGEEVAEDNFDSNLFDRISQVYSRKWQNDELKVYNLLDSKK